LANINGPHLYWVGELEEDIKFIIWWIGLGILSSVGLGTGMHTGLLFLFPHIMKVCMAATECGSTNFPSRSDMWFRSDPSVFMCTTTTAGTAPFFDIFKKVFLPCMLWGTGTAIGEIPPYAISYAASKSGVANREFLDIQESKSNIPLLDAMKVWMINFLKRHGFVGVILMSAWPNAAFDLCGICCGHFLMPFWTFFLATFVGKALLKVNGQACFFITLFTEEYLSKIVGWVEHIISESLDPCIAFVKKPCHEFLKEALHKARDKFYNKSNSEETSSWLSSIWNFIILAFISLFVISCIQQFAQAQAAKMKIKQIQILKDKKRKVEITAE